MTRGCLCFWQGVMANKTRQDIDHKDCEVGVSHMKVDACC